MPGFLFSLPLSFPLTLVLKLLALTLFSSPFFFHSLYLSEWFLFSCVILSLRVSLLLPPPPPPPPLLCYHSCPYYNICSMCSFLGSVWTHQPFFLLFSRWCPRKQTGNGKWANECECTQSHIYIQSDYIKNTVIRVHNIYTVCVFVALEWVWRTNEDVCIFSVFLNSYHGLPRA